MRDEGATADSRGRGRLPVVDGLGDWRPNWAVQADGRRVFHGGDTMFRGCGRLIARRFSPFDAAFLPSYGTRGRLPRRRRSSTSGTRCPMR
ncbi:hypothetical protein ACFPN7_12005 [Amycolatopsis halotolerans]|uniref:hypothetical protein n=1 Tax=Amycolatopsis halotolerans TaxID=330083 RepID=UPI00361A7AFC